MKVSQAIGDSTPAEEVSRIELPRSALVSTRGPAHRPLSPTSPFLPIPPPFPHPLPRSQTDQSWIVKSRSRVIRVGETESRLGEYTFRRRSSIIASLRR